jgi:hypothetical protein
MVLYGATDLYLIGDKKAIKMVNYESLLLIFSPKRIRLKGRKCKRRSMFCHCLGRQQQPDQQPEQRQQHQVQQRARLRQGFPGETPL